MKEYAYHPSFEGLMSAFSRALEDNAPEVSFISEDELPARLSLSEPVRVAPDGALADELAERISAAGGRNSLRRIIQAWMSEEKDLEPAIFHYARTAIARRTCPDGWVTDSQIASVVEAARNVSAEIHRFKGLLRFSRLADGTYYAAFEPDHNIIVPVSRYFTTRLRDSRWIIHDCRRALAFLWDLRNLQPIDASEISKTDPAEFWEKCWCLYTGKISVEERKNPRLQRQLMPRRYWKHLTEMKLKGIP